MPAANQLVVYVHIPKTAGTSFRRLVASQFPERFRVAPNTFTHAQVAEERLRALLQEEPTPLAIGGHIVFGLRDALPRDARYVTVLRDPIERTLSHYGYLVAPRDSVERPHGLLARETPHRGDLTLEEALADPRYLLDNLQTRMVVCRRSPFEELPADALGRAKEHLERRFSVVGVTERLDELAALLTVARGWRPRLSRPRRVGEQRPTREALTPAQLAAVEAHNALDLELYTFAAELQQRAVAPVAAEVELELTVLARARQLREEGKRAKPLPDEQRARLVHARAVELLEHDRAYRLERRRRRQSAG
jgi:hypothetical protein